LLSYSYVFSKGFGGVLSRKSKGIVQQRLNHHFSFNNTCLHKGNLNSRFVSEGELTSKNKQGLLLMSCCKSSSVHTMDGEKDMNSNWKQAKSVYDFDFVDIDGNQQSMEMFKGHPLIVVNVASK
jgi:hypothetical protein